MDIVKLGYKPFYILPYPDSESVETVCVHIEKGIKDRFEYENMDATEGELKLWYTEYLSGISSFIEIFFPSSSIIIKTVDDTQVKEPFKAVAFDKDGSYESGLLDSIVKLALDLAHANRKKVYKHYDQ